VPWTDRPHWSCSGFNEWRGRLAKTIGIDLKKMEGYAIIRDNNGFYESDPAALKWPPTDDPIFILLRHSDCDGEISTAECEKLLPRLEEMLALMPRDQCWEIFDGKESEKFVGLLKVAIDKKKPVEFG